MWVEEAAKLITLSNKVSFALHPTLSPYTLHPTPYTLHPAPYTLHPAPYTLNPTLYTLTPQRFNPKEAARVEEAMA